MNPSVFCLTCVTFYESLSFTLYRVANPKSIRYIECRFLTWLLESKFPTQILSGFKSLYTSPRLWNLSSRVVSWIPIYITVFSENNLRLVSIISCRVRPNRYMTKNGISWFWPLSFNNAKPSICFLSRAFMTFISRFSIA